MEVPPPRLEGLSEAISWLGDISDFLENRGYTKETNSSHSLLDDLARLHCASLTNRPQLLIISNDSTCSDSTTLI